MARARKPGPEEMLSAQLRVQRLEKMGITPPPSLIRTAAGRRAYDPDLLGRGTALVDALSAYGIHSDSLRDEKHEGAMLRKALAAFQKELRAAKLEAAS